MFGFVTDAGSAMVQRMARAPRLGNDAAPLPRFRLVDDGLTLVECSRDLAVTLMSALRREGYFVDRTGAPGPRKLAIGKPIVTRAAAATIRPSREAWKR